MLERSDPGEIADYVLGERSRIAARRERFLPLPLSPRHQGTSARLNGLLRTFEDWNPEYLHMLGRGDGAEIRDDIVLRIGRNQGGQENDVRNALVDRGERVVERVGDHDVFGYMRAKSLAQEVGLNRIGLNDEKPRHSQQQASSCCVPDEIGTIDRRLNS